MSLRRKRCLVRIMRVNAGKEYLEGVGKYSEGFVGEKLAHGLRHNFQTEISEIQIGLLTNVSLSTRAPTPDVNLRFGSKL